MNPGLLKSVIWWLCEKAGHPFPHKAWIFNGRYHRDCRWCGRIISESVRGEK